MSEDRFREVFTRLASETPDPPAFSDLETHQATPESPTWVKPWMAVAGAAAVVLIVVGIIGFLGGGGPDLAQPDEPTVDYINIELSMTVNPVCDGGSIVDNRGFDDATIEIWGPNTEGLTLMVVTFPDGSEERTVTEGDIWRPDQTWVSDPDSTNFRVVQCEGTSQDNLMLASGLSPDGMGTVIPAMFLAAPEPTFGETFRGTEPEKSAWNGISALRYQIHSDGPVGTRYLEVYVSDDDTRLIRQYVELEYFGIGTATVDIAVVERDEVPADSISISTAGLTVYEFNRFNELPPEACPVTIPSRSMTPPDTHPQTPSGYPDNFWFGKDELFTSLPADGVYQPRKSVWWSVNFPGGRIEGEPEIMVTWTLLNSGRSMTITEDRGTNARTASDGDFMIAGIDPPIQGCWQVMAVYKDSSLSYVYYNDSYGNRVEDIVVPDVVGMTVDRAERVLHDAMYETGYVTSTNPSYEVCEQEPVVGTELDPGETVTVRAAPAGQCDGATPESVPEPTLELNPDYETYQDSLGRTRYLTACPNNDVLVIAGVDGADGLPPITETERKRVENYVAGQAPNQSGYLLNRIGLIRLEAVPRNGEVWSRVDGTVVVSQQPDYMLQGTINEEFRCPQVPIFYNGIPIAYVREDGISEDCPATHGGPLPSQYVVFFNCSTKGSVNPNPVPVIRPSQPGGGVHTWTFRAHLDGPTEAEMARGFGSFFDGHADALNATSFDNGELVVMFNDLILINNASTSTGSEFFVAELYATAFQFEEVETVTFTIDGSCDAFWNWLQRDCQVITRSAWEAIQASWD